MNSLLPRRVSQDAALQHMENRMASLNSREVFSEAYQHTAPWDIGRPQPPFVFVAARVQGRVLDAGCGTGEHALYFARQGCRVLGIDFLEYPITVARQKAAAQGLPVEFEVGDILDYPFASGEFDAVIDSGLFHVFSDEDRATYVRQLARLTRSGGAVHLLCFSEREPGTQGPRRISQAEIRTAFATDWSVESIVPTQFSIHPDAAPLNFTPGGPLAWFAIIRRN